MSLVCVCARTYVCSYACICLSLFVCVVLSLFTCVCTCMCVIVCICVCECVLACAYVCEWVFAYATTCMCVWCACVWCVWIGCQQLWLCLVIIFSLMSVVETLPSLWFHCVLLLHWTPARSGEGAWLKNKTTCCAPQLIPASRPSQCAQVGTYFSSRLVAQWTAKWRLIMDFRAAFPALMRVRIIRSNEV